MDDNIDDLRSKYKIRIHRFNNIITQNKKIYFVYINEDYMYNKFFREEKFNSNKFNEMLELECFLKKIYKY